VAALDSLLRAALQNRMEALVLVPGGRPRMRLAGVEHEVTQTALDARKIELLLREVAPPGVTVGEGASFGFDHQLDGRPLRFVSGRDEKGWRVTITPVAAPTVEDTSPVLAPPEAGERKPESIDELLERMLAANASDLHLSSHQRPRMRVHGDLDELPGYSPLAPDELVALLDAIAPERNREQFAATNDTDFAHELPGRARFRVNFFRDLRGPGAVLRTIPSRIPTFEELGLPEAIRGLAHLAKGLVLVTGPTGSGKSTTLAAIVDLVNRTRSDHVITIEDPIEFVHPSKKCLVNQREVGVSTGSFKQALRAALREDPDVVLVGEMRDLETISIALETAETGHLVFGTLHTTTAPSTIERLVDQFPGDRQGQIRMMLADSLKAVIAQTLLERIGGGRVAAYEILIATPAVSNLIREGKTYQIASAMQTGRAQGMLRLNDALFELIDKGIVEARAAYLQAVDKEALVQKLRAAGKSLAFLAELRSEG
jgi:twitching motility protein PilT